MIYKMNTSSSSNIEILQEGVIDKIKEFFSKIINAIKDFFARIFGKNKNKIETDLQNIKKNIELLEQGHDNLTDKTMVDEANKKEEERDVSHSNTGNDNTANNLLPQGDDENKKEYKLPKLVLENVLDLSRNTTINWITDAIILGEKFISDYNSASKNIIEDVRDMKNELETEKRISQDKKDRLLVSQLKINENFHSSFLAHLKSKPNLIEKVDNCAWPEIKEIEGFLTKILDLFNRLNKFKDKINKCLNDYQNAITSQQEELGEAVCNKVLSNVKQFSDKVMKLININTVILMRLEDEYSKILNVYMRFKNHPCEDDTITITFSSNVKGVSEGTIVYGSYGIFSEISMI